MSIYAKMSEVCQDIIDELTEHLCDANDMGPEDAMEYILEWLEENHPHCVEKDVLNCLGKVIQIRDSGDTFAPLTIHLTDDRCEILAKEFILNSGVGGTTTTNEEYLQDLDDVAMYLSEL